MPSELRLQLDGWAGPNRRPIRPAGEPEMNVGHDYLVLLTHLVPTAHVVVDEWAPTSVKAIIPISFGQLNVVDRAPVIHQVESSQRLPDVRALMTGKSVAQLVSQLNSTPTAPSAAPFMSLPADERYQKALGG